MGQILTFYSYKGGVGRSMALANVAVVMAQLGYKVLMIDWDLEAPGLENFFKPFLNVEEAKQSPGIVEILSKTNTNNPSIPVNSDENVISFQIPNSKRPLNILTAGRKDKDYFEKVRNLNVEDFYLHQNGGQFLEALRNTWKEKYDFILIDSRTGITDIGGICTVHLPDILILLFTPTEQSFQGIKEVAKKAFDARQKLPVDRMALVSVPILSRFDTTTEYQVSQQWLDRFAFELSSIYDDWLPKSISKRKILEYTKLPHIPYFSFGEKLAVLEKGNDDPSGLGYAYKTLATLLTNNLETVEQVLQEKEPTNINYPEEKKKTILSFSDINWKALLYMIHKQKCILFLGPDVATELIDGQPQPLSKIFAHQLAENISPDDRDKIDTSDLFQVSYSYMMRYDRSMLEAEIRSFYDSRLYHTSEIHENLAKLPFNLTISFTPDSMFYEALKRNQKDPLIELYDFRGTRKEIIMDNAVRPLVYYLFGSLVLPESLVITEKDVFDLFESIISHDPGLSPYIDKEIIKEDRIFLFLGFRFSQWYSRILLHYLCRSKRNKMQRSYAFEALEFSNSDGQFDYFLETDLKLNIYYYNLNNFIKELRERYEKEFPESLSVDIKQFKPTIFLCHVSEDKEFAAVLSQQLQNEGFIMWFDKESLRGGDNWESLISEQIGKEIDYFIVIQSKSLRKKEVGFVNKEINLALERQRYFVPGIRFVIPVKIDNSAPLYALEHLQAIDLSDRKSIDILVQTIKRDWERRRIHL